jgi:oligopeptidase B
VLGADPRHDVLVFEQTDKSLYTGVSKSKSDRFMFIHMEGTVSSEWRYADADDPSLEFKVFLPHERDHEYEVEHLAMTSSSAPIGRPRNFRLMRCPSAAKRSQSAWQDLVAHRDDTYIEDFDVFARFSRHCRYAAAACAKSHPTAQRRRPRRGPTALSSPATSRPTRPRCRPIPRSTPKYCATLFLAHHPTTVYDYNMRTGEQTLLKRDPVLGRLRSRELSNRVAVRARARRQAIPVSLVYRKGFVARRVSASAAIRVRRLWPVHGSEPFPRHVSA